MIDIISIGELLIDLTQVGVNEHGAGLFAADPGGAPANVADISGIRIAQEAATTLAVVALTCSRSGAIPAMPALAELEALASAQGRTATDRA